MDGCVVAVQVEDFGLPKSAVGTAGQTSKICLILTFDFQAVQVEDLGTSGVFGTLGSPVGSECSE